MTSMTRLLGDTGPPVTVPSVHQGKGDMVTYWLEGKKASLASKDVGPDAKTTKHIAMETEKETEREQELYSSMPGFLNDDLLLDAA